MAALDAGTFTDFDHAGPLVSSAIAGLKLYEVSEPWSQNDAPLVTDATAAVRSNVMGTGAEPGHAREVMTVAEGHAAIAEHVGLGSGDRYSAERLAQEWPFGVVECSYNLTTE